MSGIRAMLKEGEEDMNKKVTRIVLRVNNID